MGLHVEKSWGRYTLRSCHAVGEFRQMVALEKEVWGYDDADLMPSRVFVVAEKIGGHALGAYDGNELVAFVLGMPGVRDGHAFIHSQMLGVRAAHRNTGIGRAMKLFQREVAIRDGYDLMEWTFDPLEIKNAFFNIEKLGAIARRYIVNQYGISSSALQGGLPTDRLVAEWWLHSSRAQATIASGSHPTVASTERLEIPAEIYAWKAEPETRARAAEVQRHVRDSLQKAFASGLAITGYERSADGRGCFLLAPVTPALTTSESAQ